MRFLRSLLFAIIFYGVTFLWVLTALATAFVSAPAMQRVVAGWGRFHRHCARIILGQKVRVIGGVIRKFRGNLRIRFAIDNGRFWLTALQEENFSAEIR